MWYRNPMYPLAAALAVVVVVIVVIILLNSTGGSSGVHVPIGGTPHP